MGDGMEAVEANMRRAIRRTIRQAQRKGVRVESGGEKDLMQMSCTRQGVAPNPSSVAVLREVWRAFSVNGNCRLTIAMFEGHAIAALFSLCFGNILHLWKKGSDPAKYGLHATEALIDDAFRQGRISRQQIDDLVKQYANTEYGEYLATI